MTTDWSPSDHPESIAVTQSDWWLGAARLSLYRIREGDVRGFGFSSRPKDAMLLIFCLLQVRTAAQLMKSYLLDVNGDGEVLERLDSRCEAFDRAVPRHARNRVIHFEQWSRGLGRKQLQPGDKERDAARRDWGLELEWAEDKVTAIRLGSLKIEVDQAYLAARDLRFAIFAAALAIDPPRSSA